MAPPGKVSGFYSHENDWFYSSGLASDVVVSVQGANFHLHKFPLISRCGIIAKTCEESQTALQRDFTIVFDDFPGGHETFLLAIKFCYGVRIEITPRNLALVYCAADYLEMIDEYGEDNLLLKCDDFFHKTIIRNWKDCILALQSCEPVIPRAEKLHVISKCIDALSMMVCTDHSLFGWPMKMYGSLQSPGGSILWNGINTGAKIRSSESDWWFEDISYLSVGLFERLIQKMQARGIRSENLTGAIMYYAKKYLPGISRWQAGQGGKSRTVASFSLRPATMDQKVLLESIVRLLPEKKGSSFCRFLLGLLRVALILGVDQTCKVSLERKIGMQLDMATLEGLLIPTYSDSDCLYDTDCVERMIQHFLLSGQSITTFSPSSFDLETSPSSEPLRKIAKLIDNYIAEVAADINLKPDEFRSLAEALPECSRYLHDGMYRAVDIYLKAHTCLSEKEKEELCHVINFQKLSIDACAHASQNERLPLRVILQVLFFEQLQLRTAIAGCIHVLDTETAPVNPTTNMSGHLIQRDGWVTVVHENQALKQNMEQMRSKVSVLEEEFGKIKQEMKRVTKSQSSLDSPRRVERESRSKILTQSPVPLNENVDTPRSCTPRFSVERDRSSHHLKHRKSSSLV